MSMLDCMLMQLLWGSKHEGQNARGRAPTRGDLNEGGSPTGDYKFPKDAALRWYRSSGEQGVSVRLGVLRTPQSSPVRRGRIVRVELPTTYHLLG
jgi:hypothetical protein